MSSPDSSSSSSKKEHKKEPKRSTRVRAQPNLYKPDERKITRAAEERQIAVREAFKAVAAKIAAAKQFVKTMEADIKHDEDALKGTMAASNINPAYVADARARIAHKQAQLDSALAYIKHMRINTKLEADKLVKSAATGMKVDKLKRPHKAANVPVASKESRADMAQALANAARQRALELRRHAIRVAAQHDMGIDKTGVATRPGTTAQTAANTGIQIMREENAMGADALSNMMSGIKLKHGGKHHKRNCKK